MERLISSQIVFGLTVLVMKILCNPLASDSTVKFPYSELEALNILNFCYPSSTCQRNGPQFGLNLFSCDCDSYCSLHNTCCLDSEFKTHKISPKNKSKLKCLSVYNGPKFPIFMVDSCKDEQTFDDLCYSNPEESNDPFLIIPVTSNVTGITYKNYFCAVCNEDVDSEQLKFWDMEIRVNGTKLQGFPETQLKFNKAMNKWTISVRESIGTSTVVPVTLQIQQNRETKVRFCAVELIETCSSNWRGEDTAAKCRDYMATVFRYPNLIYKNPHCALCNFENLGDLQCIKDRFPGVPAGGFNPAPVVTTYAAAPVHRVAGIPLLSLLVLEDRRRRCGRSMMYDNFTDKCRCNSKIYRKENGKCVYKI